MKRIAYLLHNFPGITDTFIKREIRSLQKTGVSVRVISVWKPKESQTTPAILSEWSTDTDFILPRSALAVLYILLKVFMRAPVRFMQTIYLALQTARPGLRGIAFQIFYFAEAALAADILRKYAIDHVHNHIGDQSGTVTMLAARLANIEYSITFHGWPVFFDAKYSSIKEKVGAARFIRAISYFCRSQLMMFSEAVDPTPFKVIHCGLSLEKYKYRPPSGQVRSLFCAARLSPEKGLTFLIHALKELIDNACDFELRLAGNGPSLDSLKKLVAALGVSDNVRFLGFLDEDQIIDELQRSDLFVLPSFVEGIPVAAMEAMAIGVPVVVTNIAGTSELVEDGKTGLLVRPSDSKTLANAIMRIAHDHPLALRLSEAARRKVAEEFDVAKEAAKLRECFLN